MMKSFFKKLAFVMALAMVVSTAAPAATASAAEGGKFTYKYQNGLGSAVKTVNLAKTGDTVDLKFIGITDWKNYECKWMSFGEGFEVDETTGVITAIADEGEGIVWLNVGDGQTYTSDPVKVTIGQLTATIGTQDKSNKDLGTLTLTEGDKADLAFYGITDWNLGKYGYIWNVADSSILSVDQKTGEITALKAGTTTVQFVAPNKFNAANVVATNKLTVTVNPLVKDIVADLNKTQNTIEITFDKAVDLKLQDVTMFYMFTATDDEEGKGNNLVDDQTKGYKDWYVKGLSHNDEKTVWTAEVFEDFIHEAWYEVRVAGYEPETFQASVGDVDKVEVKATTAYLESTEGDLDLVPSELSVKLYDAKGVDVTTRYINGVRNDDDSNITYWLVKEDYENFNLVNYDEVEFYTMSTAKVMATYDANGVEKDSALPTAVTPERRNSYDVAKVIDWTIIKSNEKPDWNATVKEVPAGEYDYILVTLLQDTRGDYYVTHKNGEGAKYNGKTVKFTEDETQPFWLNGLYVEYKAMHMDKMLVETDGEIASYEEGKARFALYLYNQNNYAENVFVKELLSQYVHVCHPRQLDNFSVDATTMEVMKNTETEHQHQYDNSALDTILDAYYSEFSKDSIKVTLNDIHGGKADVEDAATAKFSFTLLSETSNKALSALIDAYEIAFNNAFDTAIANNKVEFGFAVEANDFVADLDNDGVDEYITKSNSVKFRITDETTKTVKNVTIYLYALAKDTVTLNVDEDNDGKKDILVSDVDLIKEFVDEMKSEMYFEKFVVSARKVTVEQAIGNAYKDNTLAGHGIKLYQQDTKGHNIGFESDLFVANAAIVKDVIALDNIVINPINGANGTVDEGDRVVVVTDKYGKVYPVYGEEYANPDYNKKEGIYAAPATTTAVGATVVEAGTAYSASGTAVDFDKYQFVFRAADPITGEMIYAKEGAYTAEIRTVESVFTKDGVDYVRFTKATGLSDKVTFTVANNNLEVQYAGRDNVSYADRSIYSYVGDETVTKEMASETAIKELILETFNFNFSDGSNWSEKADDDRRLTTDNILYYTYTVTPSNKQLVINSVTFMVPVLGWGDDGVRTETGTWYRSTAIVNKSITFGE